MKKNIIRILYFLLSCMYVSSCNSNRNVVIDEKSQIFINYASKNIPELIKDLSRYPFQRSYIESLLFEQTNYNDFTYATLKECASTAKDDYKASAYFDSLLIDKQEETLNYLSKLSLKDVAIYYKRENKEHDYLSSELEKAYFANIDSLDYLTLKELHNSFKDTNLGYIVIDKYTAMRDSLLTEFKSALDVYFNIENKLIKDFKDALLIECDAYVVNGTKQIMTSLTAKNERGLLDEIIDNKSIDKYSFEEYANILINQHLNFSNIEKMIQEKTNILICQLNQNRNNIYALEFIELNTYALDAQNSMQLDRLKHQIDHKEIDAISGIKSTGNAIALGSLALGLVSGGALALVADIVDLTYGLTENDRINQQMEQLTATLYNDSMNNVTTYLNNLQKVLSDNSNFVKQYINTNLYEKF